MRSPPLNIFPSGSAMPGNIHILKENVCNQIAAGEVVERPASVVKELIENSLDAAATEIVVTVEKGGKTLIRVDDDGSGMNRDDLFLCLERHATSKIADETDLFRLQTLGFRGEALPSIAAVSRMVLESRPRDSLGGWALHLEGGEIKKSQAAGMPMGTSVEVRNLFFNIPARKKFLKSDRTEFSHIADLLFRVALSFPSVRFVLHHDGHTVLNLTRHSDLSHRVQELMGRVLFADMVFFQRSLEDLDVMGFAGKPELQKATSESIYAFVNRRFVKDRLIQHGVMEGYRNWLPRQRYPVVVLFLTLPSDQVDVNVHPAKREVRFRRQRMVHDFIVEALRGAWRKEPFLTSPRETSCVEGVSFVAPEAKSSFHEAGILQTTTGKISSGGVAFESAGDYLPVSQSFPLSASPSWEASSAESGEQGILGGDYSVIRILGQYHNTYIICQEEDDLVLIDQHAAHERIGFERLRKEFQCKEVEKQELLFPLILEVDFKEAAALEEHLGDLARMGFDVEPYGKRSCAVRGVPALLSPQAAEAAFKDALEELSCMEAGSSITDAMERIFIRMACHGMVRANQALSYQEMKALLLDLNSVDLNSHCPHGRPVVKRFKLREIEWMFQRR